MKSGEAPKIVQIETRYVETDAINFRDVVQSLTGKNSSTAWIGRSSNADASSSVAKCFSQKKGGASVTAKPQEEGAATSSSSGTKEGLVPNSMLTNNMSFKDFDRLLLEMPHVEMEGMPWF